MIRYRRLQHGMGKDTTRWVQVIDVQMLCDRFHSLPSIVVVLRWLSKISSLPPAVLWPCYFVNFTCSSGRQKDGSIAVWCGRQLQSGMPRRGDKYVRNTGIRAGKGLETVRLLRDETTAKGLGPLRCPREGKDKRRQRQESHMRCSVSLNRQLLRRQNKKERKEGGVNDKKRRSEPIKQW